MIYQMETLKMSLILVGSPRRYEDEFETIVMLLDSTYLEG